MTRRCLSSPAAAAAVSAASLLALLLLAAGVVPAQEPAAAGWLEIDYGPLVDRRQLSHSGEPVGVLLERLDGRPAPPPGERPGDLLDHRLLEPLLESYAFVLSDVLDTLTPPATEAPLVEVAGLWRPGEAQPAWVDLLRARRLLLESDGRGRLRAILPDPTPAAPRDADPAGAARRAWVAAWPVLRHALAAERRRLGGEDGAPALAVEVHAYRHWPARTLFELGVGPHRVEVDDTRPGGRRPPLDLAAWRTFLASGLRLEGARLSPEGEVRLLGSHTDEPPRLLGRPIGLGDLAVAYRAVFHGGMAEPYMSLDRGFSPQTSIVNYGGRLRDTALGQVSLLCDIRFKTFSQGLDVVRGLDLRDELRQRLPSFRTHLERMAADPESAGVSAQQTRLWFYPDRVDLTLSPQTDVLVLRRVRMSAASERVAGTTMTAGGDDGGADPPWTRATVEAINRDYEVLAEFFPELDDLDQVVRLLSLFTWLREAERQGLQLPGLDVLMAAELPPVPTPRTFPQQLAFLAMPPAGSEAAVTVFDRLPVGDALDRLRSASGEPLPPADRLRRALAALDPGQPQHAALLDELAGVDPGALDAASADLLAYRAERLRMHGLVLSTLDVARRRVLAERQQAGVELRVFSTGIGGLDLGMDQALSRAAGRRLGLAADAGPAGPVGAASDPAGERVAAPGPREGWRADPAGLLPPAVLPLHGIDAGEAAARRGSAVEAGRGEDGQRWIRWIHGEAGPQVTARRAWLDGSGLAARFERVESGRRIAYVFEGIGQQRRASPDAAAVPPAAAPASGDGPLPAGLVLLAVGGGDPAASAVPVRVDAAPGGTRRSLQADFPRAVLQRLVLGPDVDPAGGGPLPGLSPLPGGLGEVRAAMVLVQSASAAPPWEAASRPLPGEETAARLAPALARWWREAEGVQRAAVVGVDADRSPARWAGAPAAGGEVTLILPPEGFTAATTVDPAALEAAWDGPSVPGLAATPTGNLVVLVSGEAPDLFAARVLELARTPAMRGKLLAAWSLAGPVRPDLGPRVLADSGLAGLGLAGAEVLDLRRAAERLAGLEAVARGDGDVRAEALPGPFVWYF